MLDILISENSFSCNFTYIKCVTYLARKDNTNFLKHIASGNGDLETFCALRIEITKDHKYLKQGRPDSSHKSSLIKT